MEKFYSVRDVSEATGWERPTVYKKAARGEIPGRTKLGASLRFRKTAIEKWLLGGAKNRAGSDGKR